MSHQLLVFWSWFATCHAVCGWRVLIGVVARTERIFVADDTEHHLICWLRQNKTQDHSSKFARCGEKERNTTGVLSFMCQASKCARAAKM